MRNDNSEKRRRQKDGNGMNKEELKKIIRDNFSIIAIILISATIVFVFVSDTELSSDPVPNIIQNNYTQENILNINKTNDDTTNITYDGKNFKEWFYLSLASITSDMNCVSKAAKRQNFDDTEICGRLLKDDSDLYLGQIDKHNISSSLQELRDEYEKSLEYYKLAGSDLEIGARNRNLELMNNATVYIQAGNTHMERVAVLIGNGTDIPPLKRG